MFLTLVPSGFNVLNELFGHSGAISDHVHKHMLHLKSSTPKQSRLLQGMLICLPWEADRFACAYIVAQHRVVDSVREEN